MARWRLKDKSGPLLGAPIVSGDLYREAKPRKYFNEPQQVDGIWFDSGREAKRYCELKMLLKAGKIRDLELQPKFYLSCGDVPIRIRSTGYPNGRRATYRADFKYFDVEENSTVVEDAKGLDTPSSRLRRAIVEAQFNIRVRLI